MSKHVWLTLVAVIVLLPGAFALGQSRLNAAQDDRVRQELDRTQQALERAEAIIRSSDNPNAALLLDLLDRAKELQQNAEEQYAAGNMSQAMALTSQARSVLKKALSQSRPSEQDESLVLRHLERAEEQLDRAGEMLSQLNDRSLMAIYESAQDNLKRAWEFYNNKQYRPALKLADQVEKTAQKILGARNREHNDGSYERRRESVIAAIEQAKDILTDCGSRQGRAFLEQAEKALQTAEDLAASDRLNVAMQALQRARDMASKATQECRGTGLLQSRYDRLLVQADQLKERSLDLSGQKREIVDKLLLQAYEQLTLAQGYLQSGDQNKASVALQAATLALQQANTYIVEGS